ncbi:GCN5 family acetyltransferase [Actinoplanes sp. SE50]|uniref:GNAT family N-acetyltransferase n=1 Tax=unclassified Actinoplanes TaxID=2626549 RepID=UPI00023EC239|nr:MULTISPECIES: GNAT family N-acetyltransferase [unclassified Actinoplanes]AEV83008.1 Ribosomal-protein-serine acetyltransferase [Actinoplanes sp. SE50/110]ATO81404.1 GCN5 family acetyltransferase [Actinoplanes sp. SE50]SLL98811.1 GCN5 family acetyltransferase [Actinoplanes sp. SE50/110]
MDAPEMINAGELVLKRWEPEWAGELTAAVRESLPELTPFLPWAHDDYGPEDSRSFIARSVENWDAGTEFNYAIFTTVGEVIGAIGLMTRLGPGTLEIGYWLRTPWAGQGRMTVAVGALTRVALTLPGVRRVAICYDEANKASAAVAAKAGFVEVGREHREPTAPGETNILVTAERTAA